jgi:tRNA(Ile)-lysidine synthase
MNKFFFRANENIRSRHLFKPASRILLAVSGGQDSICLLIIFLKLQKIWNCEIGVVHCDHQIRSDSYRNAQHLSAIAEDLNLNYYQVVTTEKLLTEEDARSWRYSSLIHIASRYNYTTLVTAHTASDRSETILLNLLRGTGVSGLKGLSWRRRLSSNIFIIRPLLNFTRREVTKIIKEGNFPLWPDYTNESFLFRRNRLRKQIFPLLRKWFNPHIEKSFLQFSELISNEDIFLNHLASLILQKSSSFNNKMMTLNLNVIHSCPLSLQRRIIRNFFIERLDLFINFDDVEKIRLLSLNQRKLVSLFLQKKVILKIRGGLLKISTS